MKRWIALAARLYPAAWRKRYGNEFQALIEDVNPGWRELLDVIGGATKMQLTSSATYLKLGAAFALAGLVVATVASFVIPKEYTSIAVMRFGVKSGGNRLTVTDSIAKAETQILSRTSLSKLIQDPKLDLYAKERESEPLEDIIENMRTRAIQLVIIQPMSPSDAPSVAFSISYRYTDRTKARNVVNRLISGMTEALGKAEIPGEGKNFEILDQASLPRFATSPKRTVMLTTGVLGGLCLGLVCAVFIKHPQRSMVFTYMGLIGCLVGGAGSLLIPNRYISKAVIRVVPFDHGFEQRLNGLGRPGLRIQVIHMTGAPGAAAVELSFEDTDPEKAKAMVLSAVNALTAVSVEEHMQGNIVVLDNANLPQSPMYPNRYVISLLGFGAGLAIATVMLLIQRRRMLRPA